MPYTHQATHTLLCRCATGPCPIPEVGSNPKEGSVNMEHRLSPDVDKVAA